MKYFLIFFASVIGTICTAQFDFDEQIKNGKTFKSVFSNVKRGNYPGTASGLVVIEREGNQVLVDIQGPSLILKLEEDKNEIYDISHKLYRCKSMSGKTTLEFKWYALSNSFGIQLNGMLYEFDLIDGACDLVIDGLEYNFYQEPGTEYLTLLFTKPVRLFHLETEKYITVKPNSYLLFTIRHNLKPKK